MNILELSEQEIIRRNSLNELRAMGIEPYPAAEYVTNAFSTDIKAEFKDDETPRQVSVAGRMMSRRIMGKASFIELQDSKGRIQVYITRDDICPGEDKEMYNTVFKRLLDLGDFIGIEGFVFRTQMGEISIHAQKLTVLAKSIKPLPIVKYKDGVTYDSFEDPELRYRQRYVDLIVNDEVRDTFQKRSKILSAFRRYMEADGYYEVETPILQTVQGGATAKPFITHFNALNQENYLRIATELHLKRLLVGGFERVFEIGRIFRNEGMDPTHNPEFTSMEAYCAFNDLQGMKKLAQGVIKAANAAVNDSEQLEYQGQTIDISGEWPSIPMTEIVSKALGEEVTLDTPVSHLVELAKSTGRHVLSYGFAESNDIVCMHPDVKGIQSDFIVRFEDGTEHAVEIKSNPGRHNMLNATAVLTVAHVLGLDIDAAAKALSSFEGVRRRFTHVGDIDGITVVDDYGHHPTEIKATLTAASSLGYKHVDVVFQPHRYSRLQALCDDFADAFANADKLLLIDVFSAGEMPIPGVTSKMLADTVRAKHPGKEVVYCSSRLELNQELEQMVGEGDLLLTMGAGDVTTVGPEFIEYLTAKKDA